MNGKYKESGSVIESLIEKLNFGDSPASLSSSSLQERGFSIAGLFPA